MGLLGHDPIIGQDTPEASGSAEIQTWAVWLGHTPSPCNTIFLPKETERKQQGVSPG